jgi:hypothetical protein
MWDGEEHVWITNGSRGGRWAKSSSLPVIDQQSRRWIEPLQNRIAYEKAIAAADIAFCVAAYANGMSEDRIERALEDDYLSRDPSTSKRAAYIRRTMRKARKWTGR